MKIDRRSDLSEDEFIATYMSATRPVICIDALTDIAEAWSPQSLSRTYGPRLVPIYDDLFDLQDVQPLGTYFEQHWGKACQVGAPKPYVRWYTQLKALDFVWADDVFQDLSRHWTAPYFLPTSNYLLPAAMDRRVDARLDAFPAKGLFISAAGCRTRLHRDPWASDAVLCQFHGRKRVVLHRPAGSGDTAALEADQARADYDDILEPGEVVFFPAGWFHQVETLDDSISVTWNFVHASRWKSFLAFLTQPMNDNDTDILRFFATL